MNPSENPIPKQVRVWRMSGGTRIRICDMKDRHLDNTIALLERKASQRGIPCNADGTFSERDMGPDYTSMVLERERRIQVDSDLQARMKQRLLDRLTGGSSEQIRHRQKRKQERQDKLNRAIDL